MTVQQWHRPSIGLLSLEPWDATWRRNQHLVSQLIEQDLVASVAFINPPVKMRHIPAIRPLRGVRVVTPHLVIPRQRGGGVLVAREVSARIRGIDLLWVNDPTLGSAVSRRNVPVVYDVTDDWRAARLPDEHRRRLVRSEDALAGRSTTIVCSNVLRDRWRERYGVDAVVIQNGVDLDAHREAAPRRLPGPGPHALYVGTLHQERLDVELLLRLASSGLVGIVDLVGPDHLSDAARAALGASAHIRVHPPVPHQEVPSLMAGADVLMSPHLVDDFTLSLDAIKSFEYLASGRPVVATPTSGFQLLTRAPGLWLASGEDFLSAVREALISRESWEGRAAGHSWADRARQFSAVLRHALDHD